MASFGEYRTQICPRCKKSYKISLYTGDGGSSDCHACADGTFCYFPESLPKEKIKNIKLKDNDFIKNKMKRRSDYALFK